MIFHAYHSHMNERNAIRFKFVFLILSCVLLNTIVGSAKDGVSQKPPKSIANQQTFKLGDERLVVTLIADIDPTHKANEHYALRFDRSAAITKVTCHGKQLINRWGMPDEFGQIGIGVLGFDDAKIGESFIKPGVGVLQMIDSGSYKSGTAFPVKAWIRTTVSQSQNQVTVTQNSPVIRGYAYQLTKHYTITPDDGKIQIQYQLTNTGKRDWAIEHYNHNFFTLDNQPLGPDWMIHLEYPIPSIPQSWMVMQGNELKIRMIPKSYGFLQVNERLTAQQANLRIKHRENNMSIDMQGDSPAYRMAWFFSPDSLCPERFHLIKCKPDESQSWSLAYQFSAVEP
ncbi:MAG: hypothetical protein CMJ19_01270 [Phycisphaeraceae bacterium]|nr:hypothetical protein [Phycisphaeraceae bacterium]